MTTTVKVHVNGRYRATVKQTIDGQAEEPVTIDGGQEKTLHFRHGSVNVFEISEEEMPADEKQ